MKTNTQIITTPNGTVYNQVWIEDDRVCIKFKYLGLNEWTTLTLDKKCVPQLIKALTAAQQEYNES